MRSVVEGVISVYLFLCVALLVFNILYIFRSKWQDRQRGSRIRQWREAFPDGLGEAALTEAHLRRLRRAENLTAFYAVLEEQVLNTPAAAGFFRRNTPQLQQLALAYGKRSVMERAFFAYVIAAFHSSDIGQNDQLAEIMLSYLEDSTVYCRENVLQALYALGRPQAVEHALEILNERGWYHNPKLISDGMVRFTGDREALALRLWKHRDHWEEPLVVGVVQYAAALGSSRLDHVFYEALARESLPQEVRFALVRYFQRQEYPPAKPLLLRFLAEGSAEDRELAVSAAAALQGYPGEETRDALKRALHSRNWYVRRNAAMSLCGLGLTEADAVQIRPSGDRYAAEMLEYALARNGGAVTGKEVSG